MDLQVRLPSPTGYFELLVSSEEIQEGNGLADSNVLGSTHFAATWLALLSDSPISGSEKPRRLYRAFYKRLCHSLRETILSFTDLAHKLASSAFIMGTSTFQGEWIDGFEDTPVFFEYHRYFQTGDPFMFRFLYTFLNFGKKLEYDDETFHDTAFRSWLGVERRLNELHLDDIVTDNIRVILSCVLPSLKGRELWPKHGPGAVSERIGNGLESKHFSLHGSPIIDRVFFRGQFANFGLASEHGYHKSKILPDPDFWHPESFDTYPPSRLHFVPKNMKTARSICMEPAELMFFQQAVFRMMREAISESPLSEFIHLRDQGYNRELALFGSFSASIDTLDLSAASDSVSYDLIKRVFPPSWQIPMRATRNPLVLTPNGVIAVKKFAPMGSAVCFPTQCLIFASVCIYAAILWLRNSPITGSVERIHAHDVEDVLERFQKKPFIALPRHEALEPLGIFGDDICCDSRITPYVKLILATLGFEVNHGKSFTDSQAFRESCGGYYLNGYDVTPLYYSIKDVRAKLTPRHIMSQVHLINECFEKYLNTRRFLISSLRKWHTRKGSFAVPFVSAQSLKFGIWTARSKTDRNDHLRRRYNADLQRNEFRHWYVAPRKANLTSHRQEKYSYMRWWASRDNQGDGEEFVLPADHRAPAGYRVGWVWTPLD